MYREHIALSIVGLTLALVLISSLVSNIQTVSAQYPDRLPRGYVSYPNSDLGIEIERPTHWETTSSKGYAVLTSGYEDGFSSDNYAENLQIQRVEADGQVITDFTESIEIRYFGAVRSVVLDGLSETQVQVNLQFPVQAVDFSGAVDGPRIKGTRAVISIEETYLVLTFTGEESKYGHYQPISEHMFQSFEIVPTQISPDQESVEIQNILYNDTANGFSLAFPSTWTKRASSNQFDSEIAFYSPGNSPLGSAYASVYVVDANDRSLGDYTKEQLRNTFSIYAEPTLVALAPSRLSKLYAVNYVWVHHFPDYTVDETWALFDDKIFHITTSGRAEIYEKYRNDIESMVESFNIAGSIPRPYREPVSFGLDASDFQDYERWPNYRYSFPTLYEDDHLGIINTVNVYSLSTTLQNATIHHGDSLRIETDGKPGKVVLNIHRDYLDRIGKVMVDGMYRIEPIIVSQTNSSATLAIPYRLSGEDLQEGIAGNYYRGTSIEIEAGIMTPSEEDSFFSFRYILFAAFLVITFAVGYRRHRIKRAKGKGKAVAVLSLKEHAGGLEVFYWGDLRLDRLSLVPTSVHEKSNFIAALRAVFSREHDVEKYAHEIMYDDIEKISMRKKEMGYSGFKSGEIIVQIKNKKVKKYDITSDQDYDQCKQLLASALASKLTEEN